MKRSLFLLCCAVLLSGFPIVQASAAENSVASVTETQTSNGNETKQCDVTVEVAGGGFTVTIPKKITLSGETFTAQYEVTVKGDISGTEVVKVVPDTLFDMTQPPKAAVKAGTSQTKTEFTTDDCAVMGVDEETGESINVGTTVTGDVFADGRNSDVGTLSAGEWNGSFNFVITLEDNSN